jgi:hypothetical protein
LVKLCCVHAFAEAVGVNGSPTTDLVFDIELLAKKRK